MVNPFKAMFYALTNIQMEKQLIRKPKITAVREKKGKQKIQMKTTSNTYDQNSMSINFLFNNNEGVNQVKCKLIQMICMATRKDIELS